MLALTECRLGSTGVGAAFVNNPIVDWVGMHEINPRSDGGGEGIENASDTLNHRQARRGKNGARLSSFAQFASNSRLPASSLLSARFNLFKRPSSYFDPFASPSLFFRTSGANPSLSHDSDDSSLPPMLDNVDNQDMAVPHKAYLKYPLSTAALRLPTFRIEICAQCPLRDQIEEFAGSLRRSNRIDKSRRENIRQPEEYQESTSLHQRKGGLHAHLVTHELHLANKIQSRVKDGIGLWDGCSENQKLETINVLSQWLNDPVPESK